MSHEEAVDDAFFVGENLGFPGGTGLFWNSVWNSGS